jgi:hypothetical protein
MVVAASLTQRCAADTWDIMVQLFRDPNCFERAAELQLLETGCYANLYSNFTKAFTLNVISFEAPQLVDLREYSDDCKTKVLGPRPISVNRCERFAGSFWGQLSLRFRSSTCVGDMCSRLAVTIQHFYRTKDCADLPYKMFRYPVPGCMRANNGTTDFLLSNDPRATNITMTEYAINDKCDGELIKRYTMTSGWCYPLYADREPRAFKWISYPPKIVGMAGDAYRIQPMTPQTAALTMAAAAVAVGGNSIPLPRLEL